MTGLLYLLIIVASGFAEGGVGGPGDRAGRGYVLAGAFLGVHGVLLGILLFRSPHFPNLLGVLLVAATAAVGEVSPFLHLLVRGVRPGPAASLA